MTKGKRCKKCRTPLKIEEHNFNDYIILIERCKCGWKLLDVKDETNRSLLESLPKDVIEKMLKSSSSKIKL